MIALLSKTTVVLLATAHLTTDFVGSGFHQCY